MVILENKYKFNVKIRLLLFTLKDNRVKLTAIIDCNAEKVCKKIKNIGKMDSKSATSVNK